jgi:predicted nucleic acid-binding protein
MPEVVSNTSCLIALTNIGLLDILRNIYGRITITAEVFAEFGETLPDWVSVVSVRDTSKTKLISTMLDLGEASSIALALEKKNVLLILDDGKARQMAQGLDIKLTGTLGVLVRACKAKVISDLPEVVNSLRRNGFYLSENIVNELLTMA